jgi:hypothetical protein
MIASQVCVAQDSVKNKNWKTLVLPDGWYISVPVDFLREDGRGVDSEVGSVFSLNDGITLQFDIGIDNEIIFEKADCMLNTQIRKTKRDLHQKTTKDIYNIPKINRAYVDTINGRAAVIVVQQKSGQGLTCVSIKDCETRNWIGLQIANLSADKQDLVLQVFKSINR